MNRLSPHLYIVLLCLGLSLHARSQQPSSPRATTKKTPHKPRIFVVDEFPVTDNMFNHCDGCAFSSGPVESTDIVWFGDRQRSMTLAVELYTDYFRNAFYLFRNDDIPTAIIDSMELYTKSGDTVTRHQKRKYFRGLLRWAKPVASKYFVSTKGIALGDSTAKAIKIYGKPDHRTVSNGVIVFSWAFQGDGDYDGKTDLHGKPLAFDSFGHEITMCFRSDRLIGLIYHNDIP